jgi:lycopene beta-cyclase
MDDSAVFSCDVAIIGAGLAGLSLAAELARPEFAHISVVMIEPRPNYVRDRTWSFWETPHAMPSLWKNLRATRWSAWRVSDAKRIVQKHGGSAKQVGYASINADVFYAEAMRLIDAAPNIQWRRPDGVKRIRRLEAGGEIETTRGNKLRAKRIFDSRPPSSPAGSEWSQHFLGWEVSSSQPCFEPECLDLMAFVPNEKGLHFVYCLPYSTTRALIESTWLSRADLKPDFESEIRDALSKRYGCTEFSVSFKEQGALPLWPSPVSNDRCVTRIGRAGGTLRASTGYAFAATLNHSAKIASSLSSYLRKSQELALWQPPVANASLLEDWMDRLFFRTMERNWLGAPTYFLEMFDHVRPEVFVRFLRGSSSWSDRLAVALALPKWPFIQAALRWNAR